VKRLSKKKSARIEKGGTSNGQEKKLAQRVEKGSRLRSVEKERGGPGERKEGGRCEALEPQKKIQKVSV